MMKRIGFGLGLWLLACSAMGQAYPSRPVKVLIPYGPGSGIDVVVRQLNDALSKSFGQPFVSENRPGAAGTIAAAYVASQPADGYTVLSDSSSHTIVPSLMASIPFDTARDFSGVTTLIENPLVLVTARSRGIASAAELIAAAKAKPGSITYASAGIGSSTHISAEKFRIGAGFEGLHIPFKSSTDGLTEVMAGRIDFTYTALASALSGIRDGKLVPLAMVSRRVGVMPEIPAVGEIVPNAGYSTWLGIMVSSKTSRDIVNRLNHEIVKVMTTPEMKERLARLGTEPWVMSPEEFDALRRRELVENDRLVKAAGIKVQ
jgi:tripartite-type tricarboxylate transporter receptor subunit TctC